MQRVSICQLYGASNPHPEMYNWATQQDFKIRKNKKNDSWDLLKLSKKSQFLTKPNHASLEALTQWRKNQGFLYDVLVIKKKRKRNN